MSRLVFAAVADDDTGASDLAGMLSEQGVPALLVLDLPESSRFLRWSRGFQAVVIATATRNLSARDAYCKTRSALQLLKRRSPRVFQIKYCSTFDSTHEGNIGPSIGAALEELNEQFTIALPALPVNGRTTYMGYHFVHGKLLSESPMRHHPLTPMTNPNLVDFLSRQTRRRVGLAPHPAVRRGAQALRKCFEDLRRQGVEIAVVDCLDDGDLESICRAASELRLITGSSAPALKLPGLWREHGWILEERPAALPAPRRKKAGVLLIAGSCSVATLRQNSWMIARGIRCVQLDPRKLLNRKRQPRSLIREVRRELEAGRPCLLSTSAESRQVDEIFHWGAERNLNREALGRAIAASLAGLVGKILEDQATAGLVVAGGETAGALCRHLQLGALRVGRNIEPSVPLCYSLGRYRVPVVLKSGNFGSDDFYARALYAVHTPQEYF